MPAAYKGVRVQTTFRLPVDLHRAAVAQAKTHRCSVNEYLVRAIREYVRVPVADPIGERQNVGQYNDEGVRIGVQ
jgi:hypothetical protein